MSALTPHQEQILSQALSGASRRDLAAGSEWQRIHEHMGVSTRDGGHWLMWLETTAWVIQHRPDLIPAGSPLAKALEARGLDCGRFERIGREVARVITEEMAR